MKKPIDPMILILVSLVLFLAACNSNELSRSQTQKLIEESADFKQPYALNLRQGQPSVAGQGSLPIEDKTETPQETESRRIKTYFEMYPQIAVANHLELVEAQIKPRHTSQPKHESWMDEPMWWFDEKYSTTKKGKQLWNAYNLPPSDGIVPLAKKEFVEVKGITKQDKNVGQARFSWKWVPSQTAKYFDSATAEFKSLPANLQERMLGQQPATIINRNPQDVTIKFLETIRKGKPSFVAMMTAGDLNP